MPFAAIAQKSDRIHVIGVLSTGPTPTKDKPSPSVEAFREGLRALGYVEGKNLRIEARYADGKMDQLKRLASTLVDAKVELILATTTAAAAAARDVTRTIPIVMGSAADPVGAGLVANLARPEGNVTGLTLETPDITAKRIALLKEAIPGLKRIAAFYPGEIREFPVIVRWLAETERAAKAMSVSLTTLDLTLQPDRWDEVLKTARAQGAGAGTIVETGVYFAHSARLAQAALKNRFPVIFPFHEQADAGGLFSYGADVTALYRRAAYFADKILKGAKPSALAVEQPTRFELVINMRTAKTFGLKIPPALSLRADRLIE